MENPASPDRRSKIAKRDPGDRDPDDVGGRDPSPEKGVRPHSLLPEFEDEPPGSYLREIRVGVSNLVWSSLNLALTATVALVWFAGGPLTPASPWWTVSSIVWKLLPVSCGILLLVTVWQTVVGAREQPARTIRWSLVLSLLALIAWIRLAYWDGVAFEVDDTPPA